MDMYKREAIEYNRSTALLIGEGRTVLLIWICNIGQKSKGKWESGWRSGEIRSKENGC